ncbi:hypothetical protein L3X39_12110 [Sabulilitoribacter multivorans]|uniref:Uncharacterized protein n=1 Tax=Flaviramulus multivorans TaxID=1304750 RepID=A0ABS9ILC7_9FLAO|nr:hypothetical protein [Flaviramulus multivorans]MCF7561383.1 hypothetical protein [Flaviramulus multivorans]
MKSSINKIAILTLLVLLTLFSCRTEETEIIETPPEELLASNSAVASLMKKTSTNDGSVDNIIDKANCFYIKLPVFVNVNGEEITINSKEDYKVIEHIFDDSDDDVDIIKIIYPIQIVLADYTEVNINDFSELITHSNNCNGENEHDEDIECLDFNYPITTFIYNSNNEVVDTVILDSDKALYSFLKSLQNNDVVTIDFPLTVTLFDDSEIVINTLIELENAINYYGDSCDEDDDYDYNDDDCNDCTSDELINILTNCSGWTVDKLERYGNDYDDVYDGYTFNFQNDGTVSAYYSGGTDYGTWAANGTGNNITVTIDIPNLPYCNNGWVLHEISQYSDSKIDLRVGGNDRLRYKNNCN